ncbi:PGA52-like protein [Exophiala dermatitidis]
MQHMYGAGALLALALAANTVVVAGDSNCYEEKGNWYCSQVDAISYSNFGTAGQYQKVTEMGSAGQCQFAAQSYQGGMAPLDGEVSWHFRGPIRLKQFAFYTSGASETKRSIQPSPHQRRYAHKHLHHHERQASAVEEEQHAEEKRGVGDWVTAVIDGQTVSWINQWSGVAANSAAGSAAASPSPTAVFSASAVEASSAAAYRAPASSASASVGTGQWGRQAYYNAEQGVADGLVFLNHHGGQGSGVFDTVWGMSLSYASADNTAGSASPVALADTLIGDNSEFLIMTDKPCANGACGTVRDGTVAYHGFDGASKLFLLEFSMPLSGATGFNSDMPAAWILNAQIPRTIQYGSCSCWQSGCGEFDVFEVLDSGNQKCKSTWHGAHSLGDSNWFQRPINGTKKAAVVFDGTSSTAHIIWLSDDTNFDTTISQSTVAGFLSSISNPNLNIKVALGS